MWFIVLAVTVSFRVITFMSMLSMKRIMIMRMMIESTKLIFHNLEAMIMLKQIMLMKRTHPIFHNLEAMIMLKLLMLTMVSRLVLGGLAKHQLLMTKLRREVRLRGVT